MSSRFESSRFISDLCSHLRSIIPNTLYVIQYRTSTVITTRTSPGRKTFLVDVFLFLCEKERR